MFNGDVLFKTQGKSDDYLKTQRVKEASKITKQVKQGKKNTLVR